MRRTVVVCLVLGLVISLLPIGVQAQEITAVFHFEKPAVVKPGDSVTITWELAGGTAPYTISESQIVFTDDTSTQRRSLGHGDSVEVSICHTFHVRLLVSDAAGVQKELLSDGILVDKSEPYSCTIALDKTSLAVGEEITATWTYTGGEGYGQWITVDNDNHTTYVMDRDSLNVKSGSSTFTPTIGTRGYFELTIDRYDGGSSLSAKERSELFTIANGGQIGQPTCEIVFDKTSVLPGELITANYTFGNVQEPLNLWLESGTYFYAEGASSLHPESKVPGKSMTFRVPVNATQVFAEIRGEDALGRPFDFEKAAPLQSVEGGVPLSARIALDQAALTKGAALTGKLIIEGGQEPYLVEASSSRYLPLELPYGESDYTKNFEYTQGPSPTVSEGSISLKADFVGKAWFTIYITDAKGIQTTAESPTFIVRDVEAPSAVKGDATSDEKVDTQDAVSVLHYLLEEGDPASLSNADADGDGEVTVDDLIWIIEQIVD